MAAAAAVAVVAWPGKAGMEQATASADQVAPAQSPLAVPAPPTTVHGTLETAPGELPVSVRIPAIGVDAPVDPVGLDAEGALIVPSDPARTAWYAGGPAPGKLGPAVVVGHVDSRAGPAVFYRLDELGAGDEIIVNRADGAALSFRVTMTERYPKDEFPTEAVYGPTPEAELRLVTCGGEYDRSVRSYRDNVVVYASPSAPQ